MIYHFHGGGIRVSTWLTVAVFLAVYLRLRDRRVLVAAAAWLTGFESAWQLTSLALGTSPKPAAAVFMALPGLFFIVLARRRGVTVERWWLVVVAVLWLVWMAAGFHANLHETTTVFNPWWEALNEGAKTAWALAYLWPLRRRLARLWATSGPRSTMPIRVTPAPDQSVAMSS